MTLSCIFIILISRISIKVILKGLTPIIYILVFSMVLNIFWMKGEGEPLISFWRIQIFKEGIFKSLLTSLRVVILVISTSIFLTYTTSPFALTDAIEGLLRPLSRIKIPVHDFAMMMTIALRFIPTLIDETDKIMNAQKARGADFTSGSILRRAKALVPVLVPLFVSSLNRANDLSIAMECRCYRSGKGATKLNKLTFHFCDLIAIIAVALFIACIVIINIYVKIGFSL